MRDGEHRRNAEPNENGAAEQSPPWIDAAKDFVDRPQNQARSADHVHGRAGRALWDEGTDSERCQENPKREVGPLRDDDPAAGAIDEEPSEHTGQGMDLGTRRMA